ncbi:hypothetical protein CTAYLR_004871 [Chrysophaeum taylorii]|uniref:proline--tRNA ligase n=1 Tax=Chrysophaeum taylorii TaxID=2483200 RepID=A0AAD7UEB5_9STRA|nr:hypothetical protein CTAYLR_004871 [Chrysophaeum taylorii]
MRVAKTQKFHVLEAGRAKDGVAVIEDEADNVVLAKLRELKIAHTTYAHPEVPTVESMMEVLGDRVEGVLTKNLLLKDKKVGSFLVCVTPDRTVDMKTLPLRLGAGEKCNFRLTDCHFLGVAKGAVTPYAAINDIDNVVTVALDAELLKAKFVTTHPLRCDRSVSVSSSDLVSFLDQIGHEPKIIDFSKEVKKSSGSASSSSSAAGKKPTAPLRNKKGTKETLDRLLATKEEDFAGWYAEVISKSEMIEYGKISGCYILRPWSFGVWELIQKWFDAKIKEIGVDNCYFPMFVTKGALEAEEDHVEGFAPEVAWVTRSGQTDLTEPIAIRPTSETIMYPEFAKWLRSHRDLPLKLNQWCSVVRWEFKYPTPFLRSREFLWQEGHTAHATLEEADEMVLDILALYGYVYEELLAVPVIRGTKTEKEKFAGGLRTSTVEAYIAGSGRAIQGATSHNLGQNFAKIYDVRVESESGKLIPWQTSWGLTTRSIGVMVMVHGDNQGLVLPPRVAPIQVVIIPLVYKTCTLDDLAPLVKKVESALRGLRIRVDDRPNYSPGWKYNHWEQKGVPIRIEVGPRDMEGNQATLARRVDGVKKVVPVADLAAVVNEDLDDIHRTMFRNATAARDAKFKQVTEWADFVPALDQDCLVLTPWCGPENQRAEEDVKEKSKLEALQRAGMDAEDVRTATSLAAKTLCIPHDQPTDLPDGSTTCFFTGKPATCWCLWGRSY